MSRRCACDQLLRRLDTDLRLRTLPGLAQILWVKLQRLAAELGSADLELGFDHGFLTAVSLAVSLAETECETGLDALERRGLVERLADGRGLRLVDQVEASRRTESARHNGLRGGRPRRGETPEAARARRFGRLELVGGTGEAKTEEKPNDESSRVAAGLEEEKNKKEQEQQQAARDAAGWVSVGEELAELAGLDPARGGHNLAPVKGWMDAGASPALLRQVVGAVASRPSYRRGEVRSLMYFNLAVREAIETSRKAADAPLPAGLPVAAAQRLVEADKAWQRLVAGWDYASGRRPPSLREYRAQHAAA